jgi:plastocyanin
MQIAKRLVLAGLCGVAVACGGGDDGGGGGPDRQIALAPVNSGENQVGSAGDTLAQPIRVLITRDGNPEEGVTVQWATSVPGGELVPDNSETDADGIAETTWILGLGGGPQTARALLSASGRNVTFHATATGGSGVAFGNTFFRSNKNGTQDPAIDTILVGGSITWTGTGGDHTVRSQGTPSFADSPILAGSGATYTVTFPTVGTYEYDCSIHGGSMTGRVVVQ